MRCGNYLGEWNSYSQDVETTYEGLIIHFYPEVLKQIYGDETPYFLKEETQESKVSVEKVEIDQMIENYVQSIMFYFRNPALVKDELIRMKIKELILLLINTDKSDGVRSIMQSLFAPHEYSFKQIIHSHIFDETLSVEDLAFLTNLSLASFKRRFKEIFNDSPAHYIRIKRLEKGASLLKNKDLNITEIAYDCGFSEIGRFGKAFKAHFGMPPLNTVKSF